MAIFPCIGKWSAIGSHLIVAQLAQYYFLRAATEGLTYFLEL
jgi:hypothetical protein